MLAGSSLNPATVYENDQGFHKRYNRLLLKLNKETNNPLRRNRHYLL